MTVGTVIAALVLALAGRLEVQQMQGTIDYMEGGVLHMARASVMCELSPGKPILLVYSVALPMRDEHAGGLIHEMGHIWDCLDDGKLNGSIMPPGGQNIVPSSESHCWVNPAETAACWYAVRATKGW